MHERIKVLRKSLGLTQQEFADKLGIKANTISQYESGRNNPIDAVISLICREFHVSEEWLRTGEGEMFSPLTRDEELSAFFSQIMDNEADDFKTRLVRALSKLDESQWKMLQDVATMLISSEGEPRAQQAAELYIKDTVAQVGENVRRELELGKKAAERSSLSRPGDTA